MKSQIFAGTLLLIMVFTVSCKHIAYRSHAKHLSISFGSGGGFTGAVNEYILKGSGELYEVKAFSSDTVHLKTIPKKDLKKIFKYSESDQIQKILQNESGNMYRFIKLYKDGTLKNNFQWPQGKTDLPAELNELNQLLNQLIQP